MHESIVISGVEISNATRCTIDLPIPSLYTHSSLHMPVQIIRGKRSGPCLFISAALHGDEINGVEIIRRLLALPLMSRLRGTLIAVPVVNVYGLIEKSRYLPDRRDLNRSFPGSERGSLAARIANTFLQEIVANADAGIDLHTGAQHRSNLPQIRTDLDNPDNRLLAEAFGAPVILDSPPLQRSLREVAGSDYKIPILLYEGGEALRFDELAIRAGVRGAINVMRKLDMLPPGRRRTTPSVPVITQRSHWLRAPQSGILRAARALGAEVKQDEILAFVSDPFGDQEAPVIARYPGIIIGLTHLPLVNEGDALFHVARVAKPEELEDQLERYHEDLSEMDELADPDEIDKNSTQ